ESPFWVIHLYMTNGALVQGVNIKAHGHNNDGIDPEMSKNILIQNCVFDQGDDAVAIKSGRNQEAWRLNSPSKNIVIRNCRIKEGHQLLALGSELSSGIENIYLHDCILENEVNSKMNHILFIKSNERRGGYVSNIYVKNLKVNSLKSALLGIDNDVLYQWKSLVPTLEKKYTKMNNIHLENITVKKTPSIAKVFGNSKYKVKNIFMDSIKIESLTDRPWIIKNSEEVKTNSVIYNNQL
ncbi:MAG: glycosyl hydrolase family 28 protein, partial [Maribacter sp.]